MRLHSASSTQRLQPEAAMTDPALWALGCDASSPSIWSVSVIWPATLNAATVTRWFCCSPSSAARSQTGRPARRPCVLQFLAHLEDARGCSVQTRNQTHGHLFVCPLLSRSPEHVEWCMQIRALPRKKAAPTPISYLEKSEIDAVLDAPNRGTRQGRRDRALLLFLYNTGVTSEAAQLTVGDLQLTAARSGSARFGRAPRACWPPWLMDALPGAGPSTGTDNRSPASASDAWSVAMRPSPQPVRRRSSASASART